MLNDFTNLQSLSGRQRKNKELYKFFQLKVIVLQNILKKKPDEGPMK